jgi:hypothetical protein
LGQKTLLQIVNAAQAELGLPQSTTTLAGTGTSDLTGVQMAALANRVIDEMRRMNPMGWAQMQFEFNLVVNPPVITTGTMASQSAVITGIPTTAGLAANYWQVAGAGISAAARIKSVDSLSQVTMTMENTNTSLVSNTPITFSQDTYGLPTDFDWFQNRTMWDRTNRWALFGPDSPQIDQWHRSGIVVTGPRRHFRQIGPFANSFRLWPSPSEIVSPLQIVFEYLSRNAVAINGVIDDSTTSFAQYFVNDADVPLLDDNAIIMGVKWLFWEAKGFGSYTVMQSRWVDYVQQLIARDGSAETLQMSRRTNPLLLSPNNVQDGFWPGPTGPNTA